MARFSPVKLENNLNVSVGAGSSYSDAEGASFLDATTVSIGCMFETRPSSPPLGEASGSPPCGANQVYATIGLQQATLPRSPPSESTEPELAQGCSSAMRRSRSVDTTFAQYLSPSPNHINPQPRTRHPSLPPFNAPPVVRPVHHTERMLEPLHAVSLQPQTTQQSDSPVADSPESTQPHPLPPFEGEAHALQSQVVPQPVVSEAVQTHRKKKRRRSKRNHVHVTSSPADSPITSTAEVF